MLNRYSKQMGCAVLLVGVCIMSGGLSGGLSGCAPAPDASRSYPVSPPPVTPPPASQPAMSAATIKVPPDAIELSNGDYPPPAFPEPSQPGLLMVVDMDGDPTVAVASTAVTGKDAGKMMSITDVANMSITMNKAHKYRILFKPDKAMPMTMP